MSTLKINYEVKKLTTADDFAYHCWLYKNLHYLKRLLLKYLNMYAVLVSWLAKTYPLWSLKIFRWYIISRGEIQKSVLLYATCYKEDLLIVFKIYNRLKNVFSFLKLTIQMCLNSNYPSWQHSPNCHNYRFLVGFSLLKNFHFNI